MKQKVLQMKFVAPLRVCLAFFVAFLFSNHTEAANTYAAVLVHSSNQFFSAPDSPSLSVTGDMTIEAWIKLASQPGGVYNYTIVSKTTESGHQQSFGLRYLEINGVKSLDAFISHDGSSETPQQHPSVAATIPTGQWTHIALVYSASAGTLIFYTNGIQVGATKTGMPNSIYDATAPFIIGGYDQGAPTTLFDGQIDDVRLWAVARTQQQISSAISSELLGTEPNLRSYWKLNNSLFDSTTNGNTLVNNNFATFENTDLPFWSIPLKIIATNRTPTTNEIAPQLAALPTTSQLLAYHGGIFTPNLSSIDPNQMTIVLTHGWIPTLAGIDLDPPVGSASWPTTFAAQLRANGITGNIVAWDWSSVARSPWDKPGIPEQQTGYQGRVLGGVLWLALGANYSKPTHFIGSSLGTLVNASAANFLEGTNWANEAVSPTPWPGTNILMTLFDEAEVARGITSFGADIDTLAGRNGNPFLPKKSYDHPLPKQFAWAENYISAFGLLQPGAVNVILTNEFPANAHNPISWFEEIAKFHGYPKDWYYETIQTDNSAMGFVWPLLWALGDPAFANAPRTNSVYVQAFSTSQWDLTATNWNYGTNLLAARFQAYRNGLFYSLTGETLDQAAVNGTGNGQNVVGALPAFSSFLMSIFTTPANVSPAPQFKVRPLGATPNDAGSNTNIPAYAWMPLAVPANAVSMSFDYMIQGDWQSDSLAAAFNGTNVLSLPGSQIETNVLFSSGSIDVSAFAGQTNEFFIGIVGGTSTNAQLTVENLAFSISSPPLLQSLVSGNSVVLSWPLSAADYALQTSTNLTDINSWTAVPNVPAIVNLQNTVTNSASAGAKFYRLKK